MEQFRNLQQFSSVKEFDQHRSQVFYRIKDKLSKGALAVWNLLARRATDIPGVCWVQIDTIAESAGVSRSTVERAIRLFKKLGLIAIKETIRPKTGGDGANVYVFQKLGEGAQMTGREVPEKPCHVKDEEYISKNDTKISLDLKHNNNQLNTKRSPYIKFVPERLQQYKDLFGKLLKDLYSRVWLAAKKLKLTVEQGLMQQIGSIVMHQLMLYKKVGKQFTDDQLCILAYKIAFNQLSQRVESGEIADFNDFYNVLDKAKTRLLIKREFKAAKNEFDELGVF